MDYADHMYGSLVIYSPSGDRSPLASRISNKMIEGEHRFLRFSRAWRLDVPTDSHLYIQDDIIIPSRNRHLMTHTLVDIPYTDIFSDNLVKETVLNANREICKAVSEIEGEHENARLLHRLEQARKQVAPITHGAADGFATFVNNVGSRNYFGLLSTGVPIYLYGAVDQDQSVHLVWSTDEGIGSALRATHGDRLHLYRFPEIVDRPLFISTQFVCSYWHRWSKEYKNNALSYLHAFNALEIRLYKDPNIPVLPQGSAINLSSSKAGEVEEL